METNGTAKQSRKAGNVSDLIPTEVGLREAITQAIALGLFTIKICYEGAVPCKDVNLIRTYLDMNKVDIKEILNKRCSISLT